MVTSLRIPYRSAGKEESFPRAICGYSTEDLRSLWGRVSFCVDSSCLLCKPGCREAVVSWLLPEAPSVLSLSTDRIPDDPFPIESHCISSLFALSSLCSFFSHLSPPSSSLGVLCRPPSPTSMHLNTTTASVWSTTSSQSTSSMKCLDCVQLTFDLSASCSRESCGLDRIECYTLLYHSRAHLLEGKEHPPVD